MALYAPVCARVEETVFGGRVVRECEDKGKEKTVEKKGQPRAVALPLEGKPHWINVSIGSRIEVLL